MTDMVMPRLSDTMEEGTVLRWLKHDGEHVQRGEELVEIETDKAAMTYESDREGVLETVAREGDTLAVGELIARIGESTGEDISGESTEDGSVGGGEDIPRETAEDGSVEDVSGEAREQGTSMEARRDISGEVGEPEGVEIAEQTDNSSAEPPIPTVEPYNGSPIEQSPPSHGGRRVKASPLARRIARETGVDLTELTGSGPGGRIVKADVEASVEPQSASVPPPDAPSAEPPNAPSPEPPDAPSAEPPASPPSSPSLSAVEEVSSAKGQARIVEPSRTQRAIARRMAESKATIPDFSLTTSIDMERCVELRAELKRLSHADAPTYNDMIVKACALALREHPRANGSYRDGRFELHSRVNVGVAVAVASDDPTGDALVVPTVFDADTKALGEIARETRTLAERVRDGTVTPPELSGGTFTVSNLGMYGITSFTAIVNPPQAAILAVGAVASRAVVRASVLLARHMMSVTLACDHRILYGADAAVFLARVRELLEEPAALTL